MSLLRDMSPEQLSKLASQALALGHPPGLAMVQLELQRRQGRALPILPESRP